MLDAVALPVGVGHVVSLGAGVEELLVGPGFGPDEPAEDDVPAGDDGAVDDEAPEEPPDPPDELEPDEAEELDEPLTGGLLEPAVEDAPAVEVGCSFRPLGRPGSAGGSVGFGRFFVAGGVASTGTASPTWAA